MTATSHRKETIPLSESTRGAIGTVQWLLEHEHHPVIHHHNRLQVAICGEEAFGLIAADIAKAKKCIDLVCWGFDPAMELVRTGEAWPRGATYGDLLADAAEKRNVQVRLLCWYDPLGSSAPIFGVNNMPGFSKQADGMRHVGKTLPRSTEPLDPAVRASLAPASVRDKRSGYNAGWYQCVFGGRSPIAIRTCTGDKAAVQRSLQAVSRLGQLGEIEALGLTNQATHHQKTILIDYEGEDPVGYVMGLNSVTDYWDTQAHLFDDPRRGAQWEGDSARGPGLKPYQDYVCRVQGPALVELHQNFSSAWGRAKVPNGAGPASSTAAAQTPPSKPPTAPRANANAAGGGPAPHRAQIVRTQPEEGERTIDLLYSQASSFARSYLYVENQYFQYTPWAVQLKKDRAAHAEGWRAAGRRPKDLPTLHVMAVIPVPEKAQMVPRTHDTVKSLGQGSSMPDQNKAVEEELKHHRQQQAAWDAHVERQRAKGEVPDPAMYPAPLSDIARTARDAGEQQAVDKELETIGMRTLVGSLWTYDQNWRATQRTTKKQDMAARYREIYIHSKLMIIDDSMFTLGSANLNLRSMAVDSEINIASDDMGLSTDLRRRVWGMHTEGTQDGGDGSAATIVDTFGKWGKLMQANRQAKDAGSAPVGFLQPFKDERTSHIRLG